MFVNNIFCNFERVLNIYKDGFFLESKLLENKILFHRKFHACIRTLKKKNCFFTFGSQIFNNNFGKEKIKISPVSVPATTA